MISHYNCGIKIDKKYFTKFYISFSATIKIETQRTLFRESKMNFVARVNISNLPQKYLYHQS